MTKLISLDDAARQTSTSVWFWRRAISEGRIPSVKLGRRRLIEETVLEKTIEQGRQNADAKPEFRLVKNSREKL
jgi:excisionase family DNA binding protein